MIKLHLRHLDKYGFLCYKITQPNIKHALSNRTDIELNLY